MPAAVCPVPRLVRMSRRTMPESASAFSVLLVACDPSAGYGPAVSWGISTTVVVAAVAGAAAVVAVAVAVVAAVAVGVVVAVGAMVLVAGTAVFATVPHPANSTPMPRAPSFRMR